MSALGTCNVDRHATKYLAETLRRKARDGLPLRVYVMPSGEVRTRRRDDAGLEAYLVGKYTNETPIVRFFADIEFIKRERTGGVAA